MSPAKKPHSTPTKKTRIPTADERISMIAEAAYYKAEHRGFSGGSPEADWWEAEKEIDSMLTAARAGGNGRRARAPRAQSG
jgi:hypothetical protein